VVFASGNDGVDLYQWTPGSADAPIRLTSRRGSLNTSPTFSPDGRRIAFTSGLLGHPEVYIMDADGSSFDLLTSQGFGDQLYRSDPAWSPDGRRVAYQSQVSPGTFQIMTISVRDGTTQQFTSEGSNEDPSWAPDGRHMVFVSNRTGARELWVLDTESSRARQLTHGGRVQNPAWSPRLDLLRQP
jgi:TolB protein